MVPSGCQATEVMVFLEDSMPLWEMPVGREGRVREGHAAVGAVAGGKKSQSLTNPSEEPVAKRSTFLGFHATLETTSRCSVHTPISSAVSACLLSTSLSFSLERGLGRRDLSGEVARDGWVLGTWSVCSLSFFLDALSSSSASLIRARLRLSFSFRASAWAVPVAVGLRVDGGGGGEGDRSAGAGDELGRLLFLFPFDLSFAPSSGGGNASGRFGGGSPAWAPWAAAAWSTEGSGRGGLARAEG